MNYSIRPLITVSIIFLFCVYGCKPTYKGDIAISNINVVDIVEGKVVQGQDVIIEIGKIRQIIPTGEVSIESPVLLNGEGKFLIPGLWDMHVHTSDADIFSSLYLANGITGIRDMGGLLSAHFQDLSTWRTQVRMGEKIGPEIKLGSLINDEKGSPGEQNVIYVSDSVTINEIVKSQKALGADFIKPYHHLSLAQFTELANASKKYGIRFGGHVPLFSPPLETLLNVSELGQVSIEHMIQVQIAIANKAVVSKSYFDAAVAGRDVIDQIDPKKEKQLYDTFIKYNTWLTPTVSIWWGVGQMNQKQDENFQQWLEYVPSDIVDNWYINPFHDAELTTHPQEDYETFREASLNMAKMAKRMHDYGVNLMVGSDSPMPMVLPGYGLHKELELLVKGGFTPAEVLGLATINPAKFMDRKDIGKVAPEMLADLVILNANPLENISNTTLIDGVILRGKYLDRDKLDQLLNQAKSIANKQ